MAEVRDVVDSLPRTRRGAAPALAWRSLLTAMAALAVVLSVFSDRYGFERDELYFRMLRPAWGYFDQPPLTPWLARVMGHVADEPWALRIPATIAAVLSVLVVVLITRELGGGRGAQALCAWTYAFAASPLLFGHVLLTTTVDLITWPLACLFLIKAVLRDSRWWLAFGAALGLATYNKLLIALLVIALGVGLLVCGPRRALLSRWFVLGAVIGVLIALPNFLYQATHHWPQLTMTGALSRENAGDVRIQMWYYLALLLGPPLVPVWVSGLVALWRRPAWRPLRFLVVAFAVVLIETFAGGGQLYYPIGLLVVIYAAGCVPAADFLARSRPWRRAAIVLFPLNAVISAVIAVPILPFAALADSPVPGINQTVGDQIGWSEYVRQVADVYRTVPAGALPRAIVYATNYGEAGAIARYGPALGLPHPYSAQNQLYFDGRPPDATTTVLVVGGQVRTARRYFASCETRGHLRNDHDVDNEEQGEPISICRTPTRSWSTIWTALRHND